MQQGDKLLFFKLIAFTLIAHTTLVVKACEEACTPNEIEKQEEEIYDAIGRGNLSRVKEVLKACPR